MKEKTRRAIQYTGSCDNLADIIDNFEINPDGVSTNYSNQSVKLGTYNSKRVHLNEWVVKEDEKLVIISDEIVRSILGEKNE